MDADVAKMLHMMLRDTTISMPGAELSTIADVHARAMLCVRANLEPTDPEFLPAETAPSADEPERELVEQSAE